MNPHPFDFKDFGLSYLHQDWRIDHATTFDVVRSFADVESQNVLRGVAADIGQILEQHPSEVELHAALLREYDLNYDPYDDGFTAHQWLLRITELIDEALTHRFPG